MRIRSVGGGDVHEGVEIPDTTHAAWQNAVEIIADAVGVPAALITRVKSDDELEIVAASKTPGNPFSTGDVQARATDLYNEEAMKSERGVVVANADNDDSWSGNELARQGLISFMGMPLLWPDGQPFGTVCVLDTKENRYSQRAETVMRRFQEILNVHLSLLFQQSELKERTRRDALTGACTRREFFETGSAELKRARRYGHPLCVLLIDLDHFKQINDRYGHAAGDAVLKGMSRRVMDSLRASDRYYRFGGEEFVIILPHSEIEDALLVAERIRVLAETRPVDFGEQSIDVTLSIGISCLEGAGESLDDVVAKADKALYTAKENGRNRIEVFQRLAESAEG